MGKILTQNKGFMGEFDMSEEDRQTKKTIFCRWEESNWKPLLRSIQQQYCIVMLGPDASTIQDEKNERMPSSHFLARSIADKLDKITQSQIDILDLAEVSYYFSMNEEYGTLQNEYIEFYKNLKKNHKYNKLYDDLSRLPFSTIITTTPDERLCEFLQKRRKSPIIGFYNYNVETEEIQPGSEMRPLLYYLYGSLRDDNSLVITERDLLKFLVALPSKWGLPASLRTELQDRDKTFLFLGFGFNKWYLRLLFHILLEDKPKQRRSLAFEQFTKSSTLLEQNIYLFRKCCYKIHIYQGDLEKFMEELKNRYQEHIAENPHPTKPIKGPRVFISYAREDWKQAKDVYDYFINAKLNPWMDTPNLNPGDVWEKKVDEELEASHYFLVLLSEKVNKRSSGYVFKEINEALKNQDMLHPDKGGKYIIPVRLDGCKLLSTLKKHHQPSLDLTNNQSIENLTRFIWKDFNEWKR